MNRQLFFRLIICFFLSPWLWVFSAEENFLLVNGLTDETVLVLGSRIDERISPCSTFKIILSLMGYDAGILKDENTPNWNFQDGYDDFLESWRAQQTPQSWMKNSCVWYSKILSLQLGLKKIQNYLDSLEYGNQNMSGGLALPGKASVAWINSSLKISPKEQVDFIQRMVLGKLPIALCAIQMTKALLFKEELSEGWNLYGKTGCGSEMGPDGKTLQFGWFVGWIENDHYFFPFAYLIREQKINPDQRIPRVKHLLTESNVMVP